MERSLGGIILVTCALLLDGFNGSDGIDLSVNHCGRDKVGVGNKSGVDAHGCDAWNLLGTDNCAVNSLVLSYSWDVNH